MKCPSCATDLPDTARFCGSCGTNLAAAGAQAPAHGVPAVGGAAASVAFGGGPALAVRTGAVRSYDEIAVAGYDLPVAELLGEAWERMRPQLGVMLLGTFVIGLVATVVVNVPVPIVHLAAASAMWAGAKIACLRLITGRPVGIEHFFDSFKMFMPLFVLGLVLWALVHVGLVLLVLPGVYLMIAFYWAYWIAVDRHEEFWPALMGSMKVVNAGFFSTLFFLVAMGLLNLAAAMLTCGLGLIFTTPLTMVATALAYERIFGTAGGVDRIGS